mmetsp:Transcript_8405/g.26746  ORF Transcript_8405/g.26746 Transcript_8405/m.26746 type:complete len:219 (-) Transcript_8405:169-825(-)|eukprot:CAMPEP_0204600104 /NCGR_PEP_ID=MMETSP0661-20131031/55246_1 /ASSEMBLY_ACC=CAM_ASM_000606 /TAXON_ID=109239 /ORGANISM="Alexandrium margalefi, Strain AMGDE01CS-322" /LENGTH=218 /DNA_ID=CAMNT_0051610889 /DNA_START=57 /DNA_END=713 /DNA_ORIENTATION=-
MAAPASRAEGPRSGASERTHRRRCQRARADLRFWQRLVSASQLAASHHTRPGRMAAVVRGLISSTAAAAPVAGGDLGDDDDDEYLPELDVPEDFSGEPPTDPHVPLHLPAPPVMVADGVRGGDGHAAPAGATPAVQGERENATSEERPAEADSKYDALLRVFPPELLKKLPRKAKDDYLLRLDKRLNGESDRRAVGSHDSQRAPEAHEEDEQQRHEGG